jgi:hypothetical protein
MWDSAACASRLSRAASFSVACRHSALSTAGLVQRWALLERLDVRLSQRTRADGRRHQELVATSLPARTRGVNISTQQLRT